jgi:hypothetical protein
MPKELKFGECVHGKNMVECPLCEQPEPPPILPEHPCVRCFNEIKDGEGVECPNDPEKVHGAIGMHHCMRCDSMVLAGMPHGDLCKVCAKQLGIVQ